MSNRRLILAYVFLVGIPLLGLIGIVRRGQHLQAPVSVGGSWNVEADFSPWSGKPCVDVLGSGKQPLLNISQSGDRLVLALNNPQSTVIAGSIRGTVLTAGTQDSADSAGGSCAASQAIGITAELNKDGQQHALTGTFKLNTCRACAPVSFHAVRQAGPKRGEQ